MNPLRPYFAALLILLIMAPLLFRAGFIVNFQLNRAAISEKQCVNKKQPEKKCDGKCHLKKVVKSETLLERDNPEKCPQLPDLKELKEFPIFFEALADLSFYLTELNLTALCLYNYSFSPYDLPNGRIYYPKVFHPPLV